MSRTFYTQNGWAGENYDINLSIKDIVKNIRAFLKKYKGYKFSVRTERYNAIYVTLVSGPVDVFKKIEDINENVLLDYEYENILNAINNKSVSVSHHHVDSVKCLTDDAKKMMAEVVNFVQSYNYDDSDSQIDYFSTRFYLYVNVAGRWDNKINETTKYIIK